MESNEGKNAKSAKSVTGFDEGFWSVHQAAAFLGYQENTVYQLVRNLLIPARKVRGRWLFLKSELVEWLNKQDQEYKEKKKSASQF